MRVAHLALAALALSACRPRAFNNVQEAPDRENQPGNFQGTLELVLDKLPAEGKLSFVPWSDTYWPTYMGGAVHRWAAREQRFLSPTFDRTFPNGGQNGGPVTVQLVDTDRLKLYTKDELKNMSEAEIAQLSPMEKYDIYVGNTDPADRTNFYLNTMFERQRTDQKTAATWEGICHGWAPASYNFSEPAPTVLTNKDGIRIPFGSSDVKALITYASGLPTRAACDFVGKRCYEDFSKNPQARDTIECRDTNPMAAHAIITNYIGRFDKSFVVDVTPDAEVWNQPVFAFKSEIERGLPVSAVKNPAPGTTQVARVKTELFYRVEVKPTWDMVPPSENTQSVANYEYYLELDAQSRILGGEWISEERPDFMWRKGAPDFEGPWAPLKQLIADAGVTLRDEAGTVTPPPPTPEGKDKLQFGFADNAPFPANTLALLQGSVLRKKKGYRVYVYEGEALIQNAFVSIMPHGTFTVGLRHAAADTALKFVLKDQQGNVLDEKTMQVKFTDDPAVR